MVRLKRIIAVAATLSVIAFAACPAAAADLFAPYGSPLAAPQQKVEFGTGWYIRGDIGFEQAGIEKLTTGEAVARAAPAILFDPTSGKQNSYAFSLGAGYKLNDWFRFDAVGDLRKDLHSAAVGAAQPCQIGYHANADGVSETAVYTSCSPGSTSSLTRYDVLANAYVDLGTWSSVTPYVGAGAGAAFGRFSATTTWRQPNNLPYQVTFSDALNGAVYYVNWDRTYSGTYVNFAWALMAGFAIDVGDHVKLDVGYRYFNGGRLTIPSGTGTTSTSLVSNEIRAGLRYMID